jgi:nucleoside-diphosphate-sugar epimerase
VKVLFTGATGVVGRVTVPLLVKAGHDVIAVSRDEEGREWLNTVGARPAEIDLFDVDDVKGAMRGIDVVIPFATKIPPLALMVKVEPWAMNDDLRDRATGPLVDAALANGVGRFIQQSITGDGCTRWHLQRRRRRTGPVGGVHRHVGEDPLRPQAETYPQRGGEAGTGQGGRSDQAITTGIEP